MENNNQPTILQTIEIDCRKIEGHRAGICVPLQIYDQIAYFVKETGLFASFTDFVKSAIRYHDAKQIDLPTFEGVKRILEGK